MYRKLQDGTIRLIKELYAKNLPVGEIAKRAYVAFSTAYVYAQFPSHKAYAEYLAEKKGFASRAEYEEGLAKRKGFPSFRDYEKKRRENLARRRGFPSRADYEEHLAERRGFPSKTKYEKHLAELRRHQPINQLVSDLIRRRLAELGKSEGWLSRQLEITSGAVSKYLSCSTTPRRSLQGRLFEALELPYKTLDDLLE